MSVDYIPDYVEYEEFRGKYILVKPCYGVASIVDLAGSIVRLLDVKYGLEYSLSDEVFDYSIVDESFTNLIIILLDALGINVAMRMGAFRRLWDKAMFKCILTSTTPSTTATALASLAYCLTPIEHGILGYRMFLENVATIIHTLRFSPIYSEGVDKLIEYGVNPLDLVPYETIFNRASFANIKCYNIIPDGLKEKAYTKVISKGSEVVGYETFSDLIAKIVKISRSSNDRKLIYAYWWGIDEIEHVYGASSFEVSVEIECISYMINYLIDLLDGTRSIIMVTADHGQISNVKDIDLRSTEVSKFLLHPPGGEARFLYLYPIDEKKVTKYFENFPDVVIYERAQAIKEGFFGPSNKAKGDVVRRIGDLIVTSLGNKAFIYKLKVNVKEEKELIGRHGSLTPEEMLVPLVIFKA